VDKLLRIVARLRAPGGCPWDRAQTHQSLKPYLREETKELLDALDEDDDDKIREELGDVLLQILLHSQLKAEKKRFNFKDVARRLEEKLIYRHPHVFGNAKVKNLKELSEQWERLKKDEKKQSKTKKKSIKL
jgi:tetrapyrrole methylase family protein/MazG family protein